MTTSPENGGQVLVALGGRQRQGGGIEPLARGGP